MPELHADRVVILIPPFVLSICPENLKLQYSLIMA